VCAAAQAGAARPAERLSGTSQPANLPSASIQLDGAQVIGVGEHFWRKAGFASDCFMPRQDGRQGRDDRIADTLRTGVPTGLDELARLGRTTSRSPTQAARTAPLKRLTDASNTSAGSPSATAT